MSDINGDGKLSFDEFFKAAIYKVAYVVTSQRPDSEFSSPEGTRHHIP
jgi:hypothetical protein